MHRDYLGSILAITNTAGEVKEELQFGAWGTVDKFLDSNGGTSFGHASLLGRGYTGHEHFFEVSLIHMNGNHVGYVRKEYIEKVKSSFFKFKKTSCVTLGPNDSFMTINPILGISLGAEKGSLVDLLKRMSY